MNFQITFAIKEQRCNRQTKENITRINLTSIQQTKRIKTRKSNQTITSKKNRTSAYYK